MLSVPKQLAFSARGHALLPEQYVKGVEDGSLARELGEVEFRMGE